ncbi:MAG: hypothetical protein WDW38_003788 [Sanguina aurantia]
MATWTGSGSQHDFMLKDECLVVDEHDTLIGTASKLSCHQFNPAQPHGHLHRAFSVFLFDPQNRLLLQQRATAKVTFPGVWTNTCCSHPLSGQTPEELDTPAAIADGSVPGTKSAAARKLEHELGIPPHQLQPLQQRVRYLTRLHYCAPDLDTWGPDSPWGEHEIDYVLFVRADVTLTPNPEEVEATRYVTLPELRAMMAPESGLAWSPWFRILADTFLERWWADLDETLAGSKHGDFGTVHRILTRGGT